MAITKKAHWLGVLLLFATSMLLLVVTISSPIINDVSLLKVTLGNSTLRRHSSITFGTFGYCVLDVAPADTQQNYCTGRHIGYAPSIVTTAATGTDFGDSIVGTANSLTRIMILHPVACGLAFIAFLLTTGGRTIAATLTGSLVALLTWVLVLISLAVDFTAFGVIKHKVNDQANEALPTAEFGSALWCLVAAFVLHTLAIGLLGLGCVGALRARRDDNKRQTAAAAKKEEGRKKVFGFI